MEIPLVEVIRPDGTVRKIDVAANSREAVSTGSMGANIYDPAGKILTVNIPDLAVGDIVHYIIRQQDIRHQVLHHGKRHFAVGSLTAKRVRPVHVFDNVPDALTDEQFIFNHKNLIHHSL